MRKAQEKMFYEIMKKEMKLLKKIISESGGFIPEIPETRLER